MKLVTGTTGDPLARMTEASWCIFAVDDDGDNGRRVFGPDTIQACIEARSSIAMLIDCACTE